jgi:3-phosphoshikimate 1-carboxyvinyltransferase
MRLPALMPGLVALPPSKSHVLRALILAASSGETVQLRYEHGSGWGEAGEDILRGIDCAKALGAEVDVQGGSMRLSPSEEVPSGGGLSVGEAGFLGRVVPTCAALCRSGRWLIHAAGSLRGRRSPALWAALRAAGVEVQDDLGWPNEIQGAREAGELHLQGAGSSQELSALWIALASSGGGEVRVSGDVPSAPYLDLTQSVLEAFGSRVEHSAGRYIVSPVLYSPKAVIEAEVDASAAAVALCAGVISGVRIEVPAPSIGSAQGDWKVVEHLREFGCLIEEGGGRLVAAGGPQGGAELDLSGEPDLAPALAAVAAHVALKSGAASTFSGLHTLDGKESRRGQVLCQGFKEAGVACEWRDPVMEFNGTASATGEQVIDSAGDHRMAFAFALFGVSAGSVSVGSPDCIAKSWPNFWTSMG